MPDNNQARIDDMAPGGKKKRRPLSAIIIIGVLIAVICVIAIN